MSAIWDWDNLPAVENTITDAFTVVKNVVVQTSDTPEYAERIELERVFVVGAWANGEAEPGETPLLLLVLFSVEGSNDYATDDRFKHLGGVIRDGMVDSIVNEKINVPDEFKDNVSSLTIKVGPYSDLPNAVNLAISQNVGDSAFDLTRAELVTRVEGASFSNYPRTALEGIGKEEEQKEPQEGEQQETQQQEEQEPEKTEEELAKEEEQLLAEQYPNVPKPLRQYATSNDKLEITVGKKDTKTVSPRAPYDFEIIMATDRPSPIGFEFEAPADMVGEVMSGVGRAVARGLFSREPGAEITREIQPPATFPRTGAYIRNHLKFRGPSYALEMFNDILVYLGYVNYIHGYNLRTGTYQSFREYIYYLKEIPKAGGPELIRTLSQQQAAARGLATIPDHPKLPGEKAPWLERRKYYELVEENEDNNLWHDPYGYFKSDEDENTEK